LYFTCVTVLTVGYGDLYPTTNIGRALLIPWSFGGILILGLVVFSIFKSVSDMGEKNIMRHHFEKARERTLGRTVTTSLELERREIELELAKEREHTKHHHHSHRGSARSPATMQNRQTTFQLLQKASNSRRGSMSSTKAPSIMSMSSTLTRTMSMKTTFRRHKRVKLLREEKERFAAMRKIQLKNEEWKRWVRLAVTLGLFGIFWCVGAVGFWKTEQDTLGLTYWEAVYFGWVTLITLGYGDFSPHSWAGRCLFVLWVQFAVPAITILAQNMTSTVIATFNASAHGLTTAFLPRTETIHKWTIQYPWLFAHLPGFLQRKIQDIEAQWRIEAGFPVGDEPSPNDLAAEKKQEAFASGEATPDISALVNQHEDDIAGKHPDASALARQLALAIKRAARDMALESPRQYSFEEWVEFTRLIRFSAVGGATEALKEEEDEGLVEWDWLSENSPMVAQTTEAEFVLERLCESLVRYLRRNPPHSVFAENLREQGEGSLRLKSTHTHEDEVEPQPPVSDRRSSLITKLMGGAKSLQPVEEEDHEHSNRPPTPGRAK
jgi:potassium channel subfamily K, other eukaryote